MKTPLILTAVALILMTAPAFAQVVPGEHFIENFDLNEDGYVTLDEAREKRGEIFYMFDQDENGALDSEEYDLFDEVRAADHEDFGEPGGQGNGGGNGGNGRGNGGNQGSAMTREVTDLNGDGFVTEEEFLAATEPWFLRKDRNGDSKITTEDFGPRRQN